MKRWTTSALVTTAVLLLLGGGRARADLVAFDYHWDITPGTVIPSGTGSVSFALSPDGSLSGEVGALSFLDAGLVTTNSSATSPPDSYNENFALGLDLKDTASGETGTLTFAGTITGTLGADSSTLVATFTNPTQILPLGTYLYEVTINPTTANLPVPGSSAPTLLDAEILITSNQDLQTGPPPAQTPEPSSLMLSVCAASLVWLARRPFFRSGATKRVVQGE